MNSNRVLVCGAGHQGLSMAAHFALNGMNVNLWNRTEENIKDIVEKGLIHCNGVISGDAHISIASSDMSKVISDLVMITTPSTAHKDIARILAPFVSRDMCVVLNPGRTFGAIEFAEELKLCGIKELPRIAETQTIVYTCRKSGKNSTTIFALKKGVGLATLKGMDVLKIIERIPFCLRSQFIPLESVACSSFANVGMVLHCAPTIMNVGWIECEKVDFKYYYDGISRSVATFLEKIDTERRNIARAMGYRIESLSDWIKRSYGVSGENIYECIRNNVAYREIDAPPSVNSRYIYEDVPNGLVPFEELGLQLGIPTPNITAVITVACSMMNMDYRKSGRHFDVELLKEYF